MKLRYILGVVAAALTVVSCSENYEVDNLPGLTVSTSYVALPTDGGSNSITIKSNDAWELDTVGTQKGNTPWLKFSSLNGQAGESKVTISADASLDGRTAEIRLISGSKTQRINIIQGLATVSPATCAEVIAGPDAKTYLVKGTVTQIANTKYGNWYLTDKTGSVYIYGTLDKDGKEQNFKSLGLEVGDEVTVQGPKSTYNGTVELVNVTVVEINKSLIKVDSTMVNGKKDGTIPSKGGDAEVFFTNKAAGITANIPEAAQSWLSIKSIEGDKIVYHASENNGAPRSATVVLKTTQNGKEYTSQTTINQAGAAGSKELPFTVEEAIKYVNSLGGDTPAEVYVKGIVSKTVGTFGAKYGNGSFWISSDGKYNDDKTKDFEAYQVKWLGNKKWADGDPQIAVGSEVILHGVLTSYKNTVETKGRGAAYVFSINGVENAKNGLGTEANPFNAAGAVAAANAGTKAKVYVSGIVSKLQGTFSAKYGNGSFWISADGKYTNDKATNFEAYQVLWLGNKKWTEGDPQVAVGDKVTIFAPLSVYKGTAETKGKGAGYIVSLNGKTE